MTKLATAKTDRVARAVELFDTSDHATNVIEEATELIAKLTRELGQIVRTQAGIPETEPVAR